MQRRRGHTSHLMDHQFGQSTSFNPGQALTVATLSIVHALTYEEVNPNIEAY